MKHYERHGMSRSPTYMCWQDMKNRCLNRKSKPYRRWGARGITVCKAWLSFIVFLRDMGEKPDGLTLERIDNNGNYEPKNCRWATPAEQVRNSRKNIIIAFAGKTMCLSEWAREVGLPVPTLDYRIKTQWPIERALSPAKRKNQWK